MRLWKKLFGGAVANRYVDRCFECNWVECNEPRIWSEHSDLSEVTELAYEVKNDAALTQLAKIWKKYIDHDFVYMWKANIFARQGRKTDAINVLNEGMLKCRRKYTLCGERAMIEYKAGNLNEAVIWWIRSAVSQISLEGPVESGTFLYLAYVADAFGVHKSKDQLFKVVDRLTQFGRLNDSAINRINSLVDAANNRHIWVAIDRLCKEFL